MPQMTEYTVLSPLIDKSNDVSGEIALTSREEKWGKSFNRITYVAMFSFLSIFLQNGFSFVEYLYRFLLSICLRKKFRSRVLPRFIQQSSYFIH